METENINLDELVVKEGQEFDETKSKKLEATLGYAEPTIMPTSKTTISNADELSMTKEEAEIDMLTKIAQEKLRKEKEAFNKLSDDDKVKDYLRQTQYYRSMNDFFRKNGYSLNGKQQRNLKREIDRKLNKTFASLTQEQYDEILFEMNKASNNQTEQSANNVMNNNKDKITSLSALMH